MNKFTMKTRFLILFIVFSLIGFMVRLPFAFHHCDKELHMLFYFTAAVVINLLYPKRMYVIITSLIFFGVAIECLQEYSNKISLSLTNKALHGNFDIQDIKANITGLFICALFYYFIQIFISLKTLYDKN